ncbi:2Fe-2S iron-sulfur cluster-binding protein [Streptomyces gilvus]|uniref:2Fe-2S iron-sulfur cluster-binding protein n=1 Tax=Streptomyces gilvus TaxID=2920937 RepID=UPI001F0DA649|nr:2Fe-2S iron-sulfur cluster-binding protein [Streptomyces sp. CME 23]MCH5675608.1 2Fe-2S iron-sulfur cluster-binding protein [Streptomyces sp. CME 23]
MPKIVFVSDTARTEVFAEVGQSVMQAATAHLVDGIDADCGGHCSCATCHVYVEDGSAALAPADADETDMLECANNPMPCSRLACQIPVTEELEGVVFRVPPR